MRLATLVLERGLWMATMQWFGWLLQESWQQNCLMALHGQGHPRVPAICADEFDMSQTTIVSACNSLFLTASDLFSMSSCEGLEILQKVTFRARFMNWHVPQEKTVMAIGREYRKARWPLVAEKIGIWWPFNLGFQNLRGRFIQCWSQCLASLCQAFYLVVSERRVRS